MNKFNVKELGIDSLKVEIRDFDKQRINVCIGNVSEIWFNSFSSFELFAKKIYASYKKYKYVFEKGGK